MKFVPPALLIAATLSLAVPGAALAWGGHHGPGGMMGGAGPCQTTRAKPLTATQASDIVKGWIAMKGDEASVGTVTDTDDKTITVEIVGADGKPARTVAFDKATGRPLRPAPVQP